jgi:hypothetical protein
MAGTQLAPFRENILAIGNMLILIPVCKDIDSTQSEAASAAATRTGITAIKLLLNLGVVRYGKSTRGGRGCAWYSVDRHQ